MAEDDAERDALILELSHFVDEDAQKSFVRVEFEDDAATQAEQAAVAGRIDASRSGSVMMSSRRIISSMSASLSL